ncbi:MAG: hypothetical protein AAF821_07650 [Cyanobacteria bacterium P01_D01_bin.156]
MRGWQMVLSGILALTCGFSTLGCSSTVEATVSPRITFAGEPPSWAESASDVMAELEQWRGLPFKNDLEVTFAPQDNPRLNGWYNSETKQLVVTTGGSDELGRGVMLHEMFHALQDQHFDLYNLHLETQENSDYDKAVTAIIEGEAMLAVSELLNYDFLAHAKLPAEGEISEQRFENIFLYGAGLKFIKAIRDEGGWEAVSQVFTDPPQASTLILNPQRYLAGERTVSPLEIPLGTNETLAGKTIQGEYAIRLLLARQPETRSLMNNLDGVYQSDTLGVINTDNKTLHRWLIQLNQSNNINALATALKTALKDTFEAELSVEIEQTTITLQWSVNDFN